MNQPPEPWHEKGPEPGHNGPWPPNPQQGWPPPNPTPGAGAPNAGWPPLGQFPPGQYPPGPYPPGAFPQAPPPGGPPGSNKTVLVLVAVAVVTVLVVGGGLAAYLLTRGGDATSDRAATSESTSASRSPLPLLPTQSEDYPTPSEDYPTPSITTTTPPPAPVIYYGAIALSRTTGDIGYSINNATQAAAEAAAMQQCGVATCEKAVWFYNGCGAVAQSKVNLYWGWDVGPTRAQASDKAIAQVRGADPVVLTVQCTTNAQG